MSTHEVKTTRKRPHIQGASHGLEGRFHVDPDTNCWVWSGRTDALGYGVHDGTTAHRRSWQLANGPVPEGLVIDHLCNNPPCVNPEHLEPVTHPENIRRAYERKRSLNPDQHAPVNFPRGRIHGTLSGYRGGCRCEPCTYAHTAIIRGQRERRAARLAASTATVEHGLASTYTNWLCRCNPCASAKQDENHAYVESRTEVDA